MSKIIYSLLFFSCVSFTQGYAMDVFDFKHKKGNLGNFQNFINQIPVAHRANVEAKLLTDFTPQQRIDFLDDFLATQLNIYKFRVNQSKKIKKYESNVKEAYNLGIIKPDWFKNANGKTLLDEAKNINIYNGVADYPSSKFNFSIIIRDGQYDVSPYLDL